MTLAISSRKTLAIQMILKSIIGMGTDRLNSVSNLAFHQLQSNQFDMSQIHCFCPRRNGELNFLLFRNLGKGS